MCMTLWVFFEEPYWIGVFERTEGNQLTAARVVFGAEPSDREVLDWLLENFDRLKFSPAVKGKGPAQLAANPKRRQREAAKAAAGRPGTRSQQALSLAREMSKLEKAAESRTRRDAQEQRKRQLRLEKKKAKHRGH